MMQNRFLEPMSEAAAPESGTGSNKVKLTQLSMRAPHGRGALIIQGDPNTGVQ